MKNDTAIITAAAAVKFGEVLHTRTKGDYIELAIKRDEAPLPSAPYMTIKSWVDEDGVARFVTGHYDLTEERLNEVFAA